MFINLSNHPSSDWPELQRKAAEAYGRLVDLPFPAVDPKAEPDEIELLAEQYEVKIRKLLAGESSGSFAVHLMGELTFCFALVARLQKTGISCMASTTSRETKVNHDGTKNTRFGFVRFREYGMI